MANLDPANRVYATYANGNEGTVPAPCQWFARCDNLANGLRDAGPLGAVPICKRCDDKMNRIAGEG